MKPVDASAALQLVPFGAEGFEQAPVVGSQTPATWQVSLAVQVTGLDPAHAPLWQVYD
jgi:hypothetical protein